MEATTLRAIEALLLPPGNALVLLLLALLMFPRRGLALLFLFVGATALYVQSLPVVATAVTARLENTTALNYDDVSASEADAIVVLAGGRYSNAKEYGADDLSQFSLARLQYGAFLQRRTGLPLLVSGGAPFDEQVPEARIMQRVLTRDFGITGRVWVEDRSRNTAENARFSERVLAERGLQRIFLVTHAWHMPRAVAAFRQTGLRVIPAPTRYMATTFSNRPTVLQWLPSGTALELTRIALHELLGRQWYRIRYGVNDATTPLSHQPFQTTSLHFSPGSREQA